MYDSTDFASADLCIIVAGNVFIHSDFSVAQKTFLLLVSHMHLLAAHSCH